LQAGPLEKPEKFIFFLTFYCAESMVDIQGLYEASSSVKAVIWVLSLYPGDQYLVGRSAIIKEQVTMLVLW